MPKRPTPKLRPDLNETAYRVMMEATGQIPKTVPGATKNATASALGKLGGSKGGKARAANLSGKELAKIGKKGAKARWEKKG